MQLAQETSNIGSESESDYEDHDDDEERPKRPPKPCKRYITDTNGGKQKVEWIIQGLYWFLKYVLHASKDM